MRRADRLFQIIQILRTRRQVRARDLAQSLQVSERTIYRDMQDLSLSGVPLVGEAGVGYSLDRAYNLPPITFSESELEALLLGARMVQAWTDKQMASEASFAIARIESILPDRLKQTLQKRDIQVPDFHIYSGVAGYMPGIRAAIKHCEKLVLSYCREDGQSSQRITWPLGLFFWGNVWTMVAWCELRDDFRQFRLDRIQDVDVTGQNYQTGTQRSLDYYLQNICKEGCE